MRINVGSGLLIGWPLQSTDVSIAYVCGGRVLDEGEISRGIFGERNVAKWFEIGI